MISCWYCTSAKMISLFDIIIALSQKVWLFSVKLIKTRTYETKRKKHIYSYIIKGLLHWYQWILSRVGISTDARKLASFDIPTRDNIHRYMYQCNNPVLSALFIGNKPNSSNSCRIECFSVLIISTIWVTTYFLDLWRLSYDIGFWL